MGCAAAWALTARGADVTVYEQYELDHDRGSSHGRSRIVRLSYPDAHWVRLGLEAMDAWGELEGGGGLEAIEGGGVEAEAGIELIELDGIVELVADRSITSAAGLEACGVEYSWLDAAATRQLGALLPDGWSALFQPEAGIVRSDLARHAFLDATIARGAHVHTGELVEAPDDVDVDV